jgi:hypothetical protein
MNYEKIYNDLISKAKSENRVKGEGVYYETHHITPRCVGGSDDSDNLVNLTAKEHFIAHKLLCEIYPGENKLMYAYWCMVSFIKDGRNYRIGAREFDRVRNEFIVRISEYNTVWTKEEVLEIADGMKATEFREYHKGAYMFAFKNNFYNELNLIFEREKWSREKIEDIAKNYNSKKELREENSTAYQNAVRGGYIDELFDNLRSEWTKDKVLELIKNKNIKTQADLRRIEPGALTHMYRNEYIHEVFQKSEKLTKEIATEIIKNYKSTGDLKKKNRKVYNYAYRQGFLYDLLPKGPKFCEKTGKFLKNQK